MSVNWRLSGTVGISNPVVAASQQYESAGIANDMRKNTQTLGAVRYRRGSGWRYVSDFRFRPVVQITHDNVIIQLPSHTAVLKARHDGIKASTVHRRVTLLKNGAVLRVNVDYARGTKSELRRQRARDERNAIRETCFQYLAKTGNAFRQKHVIDAVLQICMLAPEMKLPE